MYAEYSDHCRSVHRVCGQLGKTIDWLCYCKKRIGMFPKRRTMNKYVCVFKKEGDNKHLSQCKEKEWKQDDICDGGYVCGIWRV